MKTLCALALLLVVAAGSPSSDSIKWPDTSPAVALAQEPDPTPAPSGVSIKDEYKVGEKIEVEYHGQPIPGATTTYNWVMPSDVESEEGLDEGRRLLLWAAPGSYKIQLRVQSELNVFVPDPAFPTDPTKAKPQKITLNDGPYNVILRVAGTAPPTPTPGPNPTPTPDPTPPQPAPLDGLSALVPVAAHRAILSEFFADLASAVESGAYTSTGHFRAGYRDAIKTAKASNLLPSGLSAIDPPIAAKIAAAVGLEDVQLDPAKCAALVKALEDVSADFGRK